MTLALLGTKIGMTRVLGENGEATPVTVVKVGPCVVLQVKNRETDGYDALQLGFVDAKPHRSTMPQIGHAAKARTGPKRHIREVRLDGPPSVERGDVLTVERFLEDEITYVDVTGTTKGKGFAGVMKRHGFGGLCASHGVERKHRSAGSIGGHADTGTGRGVKKGKPMAGHMGTNRRTVSSLRLIKIIPEQGLMVIQGSVPGANGSLLMVKKAKKKG